MKKYLLSLVLGLSFLIMAERAMANEGVIKLNPVNGSGTSCYALSVYADDRYSLEGACRGLVVPFSAESTYYLLWSGESVVEGQQINWKRQTEVERGKFSAIIRDRFHHLLITAESDWSAKKPSSAVVAEGTIEDLPISGAEAKESGTTTETKIDVYKPAVVTPTPTSAPVTAKTSGGSVFGAILRVIGTGLLILIGVVVVMSVITKRKGF